MNIIMKRIEIDWFSKQICYVKQKSQSLKSKWLAFFVREIRIAAIAPDCKSGPSGSQVRVLHLPQNAPIVKWLSRCPFKAEWLGSNPAGSTKNWGGHKVIAGSVKA